jgi:hypothetical protein
MEKKILNKYLNTKKELNTTKKVLEKLRAKPKMVVDFAKDYSTGYPHNVNIEGYDVITHYKIEMYEKKQERLEKEIKPALEELQKIIESIEDPIAKSIFEYRYIADMRFEEIAVKINNSYENVRNIYYRTLKHLTQNDTK